MTDECNFRCAYCYQPGGVKRLDFPTLVKAIDRLLPFFAQECAVSFYGGEPLLAVDVLRQAVEYLEDRSAKQGINIRYALTTNGSLLNEDILAFLSDHGFSLVLSFDGLAQDLQREKGSCDSLTALIPRILAKSGIALETNSVFSSETVGYLSDSVRYIIQQGVGKVDVNFAHKPLWSGPSLLRLEEEVERLGEYFVSRYRKIEDVPWTYLYEDHDKGVSRCAAGVNQIALSAQGTLWGCVIFPHYFLRKGGTAEYERYCYGDVDRFIEKPERIYVQKGANYAELRMDRFSTPERSCLMCREIEDCWVCPLSAAQTTGKIGRIPSWSCEGARILRKERRALLERFEKKD